MNTLETVKKRRSVRTFDGKPLSAEDRERIAAFIRTADNPYGIPVKFVLLDAKEKNLSSPVITGESMYLAAKVQRAAHAEEALGFAFEKVVLYACSLGIGTTWIGGTMKRELFEKAAGVEAGEIMPCVTPLGYPAKKMSLRETVMRKGVRADERKPSEELFFDRDFHTPLKEENPRTADALEMVRWAPSAVNKQPWRVLREGSDYHFYLKHDRGYIGESTGDLQKIDMGIALCHFMSGVDGTLKLADPGLPTESGTEYIATITVNP